MIITIDGPSGTGKSTVARRVANKLHFTYFDTGAMYRAFTWFVMERNVEITDKEAIQALLQEFDFNIREKEGQKHYFVGGHDVTTIIRSRPVTAHVSAVSALKEVRSHLLGTQYTFAEKHNAVFEGRDLGTVVFPKAEIKIFLTADPQVRAERRLAEVLAKKTEEASALTREQMVADLMARDEYDSKREVAPLRCPPDALQIDTTSLSVEQVVEQIVNYAKAKLPERKASMKPAWARKSPSMTGLYRVVLFFAWSFFKIFYRHKVYGYEHYYSGPAIIAGNHSSFYDPPILAISWPQEVHFLAREGLFKNRFFGGLIRKLNAHPVSGDASDIGVFKLVCNLLAEGKKIILFPEGKRGRTDALEPLKPGIAMLVARSKSGVIPAYIHGTFATWNRKRKFPHLFGHSTVCVFGTPILWQEFEHLDKKEAQKALTEKLAASIQALRAWYEAGAIGTPP